MNNNQNILFTRRAFISKMVDDALSLIMSALMMRLQMEGLCKSLSTALSLKRPWQVTTGLFELQVQPDYKRGGDTASAQPEVGSGLILTAWLKNMVAIV